MMTFWISEVFICLVVVKYYSATCSALNGDGVLFKPKFCRKSNKTEAKKFTPWYYQAIFIKKHNIKQGYSSSLTHVYSWYFFNAMMILYPANLTVFYTFLAVIKVIYFFSTLYSSQFVFHWNLLFISTISIFINFVQIWFEVANSKE